MSNPPKASRPRYQKIRELGQNREGGRVTYLAKDNATEQQVVIKQFQFAQSGSEWAGLKAYEREIQVLRSLNHPGIPRYLNSFESSKGFCMVQEYKDAQSLAVPRSWTPQEVKQIALAILEILVDLQNRMPPVIHRDIKPENILIDEQMNVYLVDFGFARIGGGEGAMSSVATGTFGFMAPEQIYNRELSNATDLYGLGATLICLLTGTKSTAVETLMDDLGRFNFKPKLSKLNQGFVNWLERMVHPKQKDRYASAEMAKEALIPLGFNRLPEVHFSESHLQFQATKLGEKLTQTVTVNNPILRTKLEGSWEVAAHPSDTQNQLIKQDWITFTPSRFQGNKVECLITVDTSNLIADKVYQREILLQTNSEPKAQGLTIEIQTASFKSIKIPYMAVITAGVLFFIFFPSIIFDNLTSIFLGDGLETKMFFPNLIITIIGTFFWFRLGYRRGLQHGLQFLFTAIIFLILIAVFRNYIWDNRFLLIRVNAILPLFICPISFILIGTIFGFLVKKHREIGFSQKSSIQIAILTMVLGSSFLFGLQLGTQNPFNLLVFMIFEIVGINWLRTLENRERKKLINKYCKSNPNLIQP
jgi:serine/threonine protein kinase